MRQTEVEVECEFIRETENAVLIRVEGEEHWIPFSQVSDMHRGRNGSITLSQWVANQKGFI